MVSSGAVEVVAFKKVIQAGTGLCWAAAAEMISSKACEGEGCAIEQCVHASDKFNHDEQHARYCCGNIKETPGCDMRSWPRYVRHKFSVTATDNEWPSFEEIREELKRDKLIGITQQYKDGTVPHMFVVSGYAILEDLELVQLFDPSDSWAWHVYRQHLEAEPPYSPTRGHYKVRKAEPAACTGTTVACDESLEYLEPQPPPDPPDPPSPPGPESDSNPFKDAQRSMAIVRALGKAHPSSLGFATPEEAERGAIVPDAKPLEVEFMILGPSFGQPKLARARLLSFDYGVADESGKVGPAIGYLVLASRPFRPWHPVKFAEDRWARPAAELAAKFPDAKLVLVPQLGLSFIKATVSGVEGTVLIPTSTRGALQFGNKYTIDEVKRILGPEVLRPPK